MRCTQGFLQILAGFYPENALFLLYLHVNAVMMTLHSAGHLPDAAIDPSRQVAMAAR
jgi:hypothetical protein